MSVYTRHINTRSTPQTKPIPGRAKMVPNDGGGYSFAVDPFTRLERFLILGCEGGHFQVGEGKLTVDNANCVFECARQDTARTIALIVDVSDSGRAPKNDPAIFALALLASMKEPFTFAGKPMPDNTIAEQALAVLPKVCRIFTHLADFIGTVRQFRGFGPSLKKAIQRWYNDRPVKNLAVQLTKYQNRNGYTQRDVLRLAKPKTTDHARNLLYRYAVGKHKVAIDTDHGGIPADGPMALAYGMEAAKVATSEFEIARLIRKYGLVREHIPTEWLNSKHVWAELLEHMPPTALIRNLGKMTSIGLLAPMSDAVGTVLNKLWDDAALKESRVHPFGILLAQTTYAAGQGVKGDLRWSPVPQITDALNDAFYASFNYVRPTGKRHYLAIDVSGSMGWASSKIANTHITARVGAACMAMVTLRTEPQNYAMAFSDKLIDLRLSKSMRLDDVVRRCESTEMGGTDCSAPMRDARERNIPVDLFVVYTDNDTNSGQREHPIQALDRYRQATGIPAKLAVVAMCANHSTIADPNDAGTLDISGFDADCPALLAEFARGNDRVAKAA
jgi:60 kDa SS-A/Ro ribonucleoprotein